MSTHGVLILLEFMAILSSTVGNYDKKLSIGKANFAALLPHFSPKLNIYSCLHHCITVLEEDCHVIVFNETGSVCNFGNMDEFQSGREESGQESGTLFFTDNVSGGKNRNIDDSNQFKSVFFSLNDKPISQK